MAPRAWSILDAAAYYALCTSMWRYGSNVDKYRASEALIANPFTYRLSTILTLTWLLTDLPLTPLLSRSAYPREHSGLDYSYLGFVLGWVLRPSGFCLCSLAL